MKRIYLVRHGKTEWNENGIYQGRSDTDLSKEGISQAKRTAAYLGKNEIAEIYSSKLKRAIRTGELISGDTGLKVQQSEKLNELSFGKWEGMTFDGIQEEYPDLSRRFFAEPSEFEAPGGESVKDLRKRVMDFWFEQESDDSDSVIVSHSGPLKIIILSVLNAPLDSFWNFELRPASISEIRKQYGKFVLFNLNYRGHLENTVEDPA